MRILPSLTALAMALAIVFPVPADAQLQPASPRRGATPATPDAAPVAPPPLATPPASQAPAPARSAPSPSAPDTSLDPRAVTVDASASCNRTELTRLPGLNTVEKLDRGLGFTYVIADPQVRIANNPTSDKTRVQPKLFDPVVIYGRVPSSDALLIGFNDGKNCGWADETFLLFDTANQTDVYKRGPKPVEVRKGPDGDRPSLKDNDLELKIVLQNMKRDGKEGAPILTKPGQSITTSTKRLSLFYVFEVFKFAEVEDPDKRRKQVYYLIGRSGERERGGRVEGWVHHDDVYNWNTRVSSFWAGSGEARGWVDANVFGQAGTELIKEPDKGKIKEPPDRTVQRFPVIDQEPSNAELARARRSAPAGTSIDRLIKNYRIATPSCSRSKDGSEDCSDATGEAGARIDKLKNVDVMFVVDATKSMEPYFPATRAAIEQVVRKLNDNPKNADLRIAVVTYGDYETNVADPQKLDFFPVMSFLPLKVAVNSLSRLNDVTIFEDKLHKDKPEASFAALVRAAGYTGWSAQAPTKIVVHIGDHGNRLKGQTSGQGSTLVEKLDEADVVAALKAKGLIYVAVPVLGTYDPTNNAAFARQAQAISRGLGGAPVTPTYDPNAPAERDNAKATDVIATAISTGIDIATGSQREVRDRVACAQNPNSPGCQQQQQNSGGRGWMGEVIDGVLERSGLSRAELDRIYGRSQTVGNFYFKPLTSAGGQMFKFYISIELDPLKQLVSVSQALCANIRDSRAHVSLKAAIDTTLNATLDNTTGVADLLASRLFIPAFHLNPLLLKTWGGPDGMEDTLRHAQGKPQMDTYERSFCKSAKLLTWVLEGKTIADPDTGRIAPDSLSWDDANRTWKPVNDRLLRSYNWFNSGGAGISGVPLYYVPIEFLPQD